MLRLRAWLRPPRNLLILFGVVLFLPAATLIALGVRLLDQDRALARQREGELLEHAADQAARAVEQDLVTLKKRLAGPPCAPADVPADAVCVVIRADRIETVPPQRVPYYPFSPRLKEPPSEPFRKLEAEEFGELADPGKALEISRRVSARVRTRIPLGRQSTSEGKALSEVAAEQSGRGDGVAARPAALGRPRDRRQKSQVHGSLL